MISNVDNQPYLISSLIYFAEKDAVAKWSFMDSFWWGLMVLTTVGYGARAPHTWAGQVESQGIAVIRSDQHLFLDHWRLLCSHRSVYLGPPSPHRSKQVARLWWLSDNQAQSSQVLIIS